MKIKSFIYHLQEQLEEFEQYWDVHHEEEPDNFPLSLDVEDWMEQFNSWLIENS